MVKNISVEKNKKTRKQKRSKKQVDMLYGRLFHRINFSRGAVIVVILIVAYSSCVWFVAMNRYGKSQKIAKGNIKENMKENMDNKEERSLKDADQIELALSSTDTSDWKTFQNTWYGFKVKYPETWIYPTSQGAIRGSKWEYRYKFRKQQLADNEIFIGFDVVVYNVKKAKEIFDTEEFHLLKNEELKESLECQNVKVSAVEPWDHPAEKIHISITDKCYHPAMFFSLARDGYILNFVAKTKNENREFEDPLQIIGDDFPQFFVSASTLDLIDIKRPPSKPKITAPKPVQYKIENGRMVCAKKNDKPKKSKKTKHKHLDMECCLDPDEYPNPWCYYDPVKYGKYF
ncbi:MAG: PsbP-related protein [Patescibacteria group bacterium]|nr:PsbP-related protein [Patescibacteria group bacterium]